MASLGPGQWSSGVFTDGGFPETGFHNLIGRQPKAPRPSREAPPQRGCHWLPRSDGHGTSRWSPSHRTLGMRKHASDPGHANANLGTWVHANASIGSWEYECVQIIMFIMLVLVVWRYIDKELLLIWSIEWITNSTLKLMMVIDLRKTLYVHNIKPVFRICHSISNAMLHAYMLYHSTYKDIIKNAQCNGPCSEIIGDLMGH